MRDYKFGWCLLENIDIKLLKIQKEALVKQIDLLEMEENTSIKRIEALTGILHLLDAISDQVTKNI